MTDRKSSSAIKKAFAIIEQLIEAGEPLALNDVSARLGLPKSSIHRMLTQLEDAGIVTRTASGKTYLVGERFVRISLDTLRQSIQTGSARDVMRRLVDDLGETCNLGVIDRNRVLYIERIECDKPLRLFLRSGSRVPLHATAVGKLLLAFVPEAKRETLVDLDTVEQLTPSTLKGDELRKKLEQIREDRVSVNFEESMLGLAGVAVPVCNPRGDVIAGLAVHAPLSRFGDTEIDLAKVRLTEAAHEIEQLLFS